MGIVEWIGLVSAVVGIASFVWFVYEKTLPYQRISWRAAQRASQNVVTQMTTQQFSPSLIFGIGRGGAIFGAMISGTLGHRPLIVIDRKYEWSPRGRFEDMLFAVRIPPEHLQHVLLVAGEAHSGRTMKLYDEFLRSIGAQNIRRAVLLYEEGCPVLIDFYGIKTTNKNARLPWMFNKQYVRADRAPVAQAQLTPGLILYVIRHAETSAGESVFTGRTDADLTVHGVEQAVHACRFFTGKHIQAIYSSPLGRAQKTAKIIQGVAPQAQFIIDDRLRELDFGDWEGRTREQVKQDNPRLYTRWSNDPTSVIPPGAEHPDAVLARMHAYLDDIAHLYSPDDHTEVIAVSHKTSMRILQAYLEHEQIDTYRTIEMRNTQIIALVYDGTHWTIDHSRGGHDVKQP